MPTGPMCFPTYVFERFVGRDLPDSEWALIEGGKTHMTDHARKFIRRELAFSFRSSKNPGEVPNWEDELRLGSLGQKPLMNPLPLP